MKNIILCLIMLLALEPCRAQQHPETGGEESSLVNWMSITDAMQKMDVQPRPILLDFYTDWCGWCKHMMKTTYSNAALAQYINNYYYPVKFDAEGKDTISFLGKTYKPTSPEPKAPHELAVELLKGKLMYPSTMFMNGYDREKREFKFNMLAAGYLDEAKIQPILIYSVENVFRNASLDDFQLQFQKAFYDSTLQAKIDSTAWLPARAISDNTTRKKTLVFIHTDWCNSCKVMQRAVFTDTLVSHYISKNFRLVDFDPQSTDTIYFKGQAYGNSHSPAMPFHSLTQVLTRNNIILPTLAVLNENQEIVDAIPFYLTPQTLKDILLFYGENIYLHKSWTDFQAAQKLLK